MSDSEEVVNTESDVSSALETIGNEVKNKVETSKAEVNNVEDLKECLDIQV